MKRVKLLILFFFLVNLAFSQKRESVYFKSDGFEGYYSEVYEQPLTIYYTVKNCDYGHSRKGLKFFKNDTIHTSDNADYYKNIWDKGHLVPAASQNCSKKSIKQTFSFLNCALQHGDLNRGTWRYLEEWERQLSKVHQVKVEIEVEFKTKQKLKTGATIPSGFFKTIIVNGGDLLYKFYFPNTKPVSKDFNFYKLD